VLPRARRALAGFRKDEPERSEDPLPIEVMAVAAERMLAQPDLISMLSGLALMLQYDLFARPSEMLQVRKEDVIEPRGGGYSGTAVIIAPAATRAVRQATSFDIMTKPYARRSAVLRRPAARPAKSGEFDDTVKAGLLVKVAGELLAALKKAASPHQEILDPLTLALYEAKMRETMDALGLTELHFTPHSARHGGASTAMEKRLLDAKGIMKRGRWLAPKSVRRYEKAGKLLRMVECAGPELIDNGAQLLTSNDSASLAYIAKKALSKVASARRTL
jgi:integrase